MYSRIFEYVRGGLIMQFKIVASRLQWVYDTVEADNIDDAYEMIYNGDYEIDWRNGDITDENVNIRERK